MKMPPAPPPYPQTLHEIFADNKKRDLVHQLFAVPDKYDHWARVRFAKPQPPFTAKDSWAVMKFRRQANQLVLPFVDTQKRPLTYQLRNQFLRALHDIDSNARGLIGMPGNPAAAEGRDIYLQNSLIEEPFSSSVLEGAATTREVAKKMIEEGRAPQTVDDRMVLNNFRAMEFIREHKNDALTPELILEAHRILTEGTLEKPEKCGVFRHPDDDVRVVDSITGETLHMPPPAGELPPRMQLLCDFANAPSEGDSFLHPILRAIILHFALAYDHPFWDGNGRCARALFYWCVLRHGYWLLEFISISSIIRRAPAKYGTAFLYSETDGGDLTYFLDHQLTVVGAAVTELQNYLEEKSRELRLLEKTLGELSGVLNKRQLQLIQQALKRPAARFEIASHQSAHSVSYLTARADLESLVRRGLLKKTKQGTKSVFLVPKNLPDRLN